MKKKPRDFLKKSEKASIYLSNFKEKPTFQSLFLTNWKDHSFFKDNDTNTNSVRSIKAFKVFFKNTPSLIINTKEKKKLYKKNDKKHTTLVNLYYTDIIS